MSNCQATKRQNGEAASDRTANAKTNDLRHKLGPRKHILGASCVRRELIGR